ncbi:MAG: hypothetical protein ACLQMF_01375 [Rectinemataceae bacterium]
MIEQKEGSHQILEALKDMIDTQSAVRAGAKEMTAGNAVVLDQMHLLREASLQIAGSMDEMSQGAGDVSKAALSVSDLAETTKGSIHSIESSIGTFKV